MDLSKTLKVQIKLKDNIYWEDGSPITAYDVVSTILSVQADETLNYTAVNYKNIKTIEALSDKEFLVTFNEFDSKWKGLFSVVLPESIIKGDKLTNLFGDNIFGSGPYKLKEWVKGQYILLESNPYYFGEKPEIEAIKFVFNSDINYLIGKLSEGNLDILSIPADLKLMEDIEKNENLDLLVKPGKFWEHLAICLKPREG
jgi:peptide/nickel transport system substrate-binding protein